MNKRYLYSLLALLFVLPPLAVQAQRLTGYEYWFDGNVGSRVSRSLSGYDTEIETSIATQHLSSGLHTLHMRFIQSGGEYDYSPVTSQLFFKHNADEGGKIEYWFDNDVSKSATVTLPSSATEDTVNVALNMTDALKFPLGFHQLNIRVATEGKSLGNVYTSHVLKMPSGEVNAIEYWVDDDFDKRQMVEGNVASTDEHAYVFVNPFNLSGVPSGPHRIYYRPASKDGAACGAVSVASVMVGGGTPSKIEYWFNGDVANSATTDLPATALSDTVNVALAMSNNKTFPLGMHQMSMRLISKDREQSPIYSARVLKKATGNPDVIEYWVDDWVDEKHVAHPKTLTGKAASSNDNSYIFNNSFDLSSVSEGFHRLYYRATSANGNASTAVSMTPVMVKSKYNVENREALTVTEQAYWFDNQEPEARIVTEPRNIRDLPLNLDTRKLSDGKHTLHLQYGNSAGIWSGPVDFEFTKEKIVPPSITLNASEKEGIVTFKFNTIPNGKAYNIVRKYPSGTIRRVDMIETTDYPAVLTYSDKPAPGNYAYYIDGKYPDANGVIQSVLSKEVNVTVNKVAEGIKLGTLWGKLLQDGQAAGPGKFKVYINGVLSNNSDYTFKPDGLGGFYIFDIPYNSEITIGIKQDKYKYNDIKLIVNENTTGKPFYFNGIRSDEEEVIMPENDMYDLSLNGNINLTPTGWEIPIHNLSSKTWSGNLIVKVISKKVQDKIGKTYNNETNSALDVLYYKTDVCYTTVTDMPVEIQGCRKGSQVVALDITDMPETDKNEDYCIYVFSKKKGSEEIKLLRPSYEKLNPQVLKFNPADYAKVAVSVMEEYVEIMNVVKKFGEWEDPFKLAFKTAWNNHINSYNRDPEEDLLKDEFETFMASAGLLLNCFYGEMNQCVIKEIKKSKGYKASTKICKLYDLVKGAYNAQQADGNHKFFELAKLVLSLSKGLGADPVLDCYKTYFEVGEAMVGAIERMSEHQHDHHIWENIHSGKAIYKIKVRKYTGTKGGTEYFDGRDFYPDMKSIKHDGQIKSIKIDLIDLVDENNNMPQEVNINNIEFENDGIVIKNVKFPSVKGQPDKIEAWMTIVWKNDRVTRVPLLEKDFVKLENYEKVVSDVPLIMTVELQSGCKDYKPHIPNHLTFVTPQNSWFD